MSCLVSQDILPALSLLLQNVLCLAEVFIFYIMSCYEDGSHSQWNGYEFGEG